MAVKPKPAEAPDEGNDESSLIKVDFGKPLLPLTSLACVVDLLIVAAVSGNRWLGTAPHFGNVMVGAGVAIILAAFGGQAVVRGKGLVFAGVAAHSSRSYRFLSYEDHKFRSELRDTLELQKKSYMTGKIDGLPSILRRETETRRLRSEQA